MRLTQVQFRVLVVCCVLALGYDPSCLVADQFTMYQQHPCEKLNALFEKKPYQGASPEVARFIFVGLDANFDPEIESSETFPEVCSYLEDGVGFWIKHGIHHPFLLPSYRGDGARYHKQFAKIGLNARHAQDVSFIELIATPTIGRSELNKNDLQQNHRHLERLERWLKEGHRKYAFISPNARRLIGSTPYFRWLASEPIANHESIPVYYQSPGLTVLSPYHFSCYGKYCLVENKRKQLETIRALIENYHA